MPSGNAETKKLKLKGQGDARRKAYWAKSIGQSVKEISSKYIAPKFNEISPSATASFGAGCPFLIRYFRRWDVELR
jgi:hypothetical protein